MVVLPLDKKKFRGLFGDRMHADPNLVVMSFTASEQLKAVSETFRKGYEHITIDDCEKCRAVLSKEIKFY